MPTFCLLIATGGAIIFFIPSGIVASKIGRKKTILIGVAILAAAFFSGFIITLLIHSFSPILYAIFVSIGIGWAFINVNSLPMVVEMCRGADCGKFTGYYYTASMAGQVLTPIMAGFLMRNISYKILFIYATIFAFVSFLTMTQVRHGDVKAVAASGLDAFEDMD